MSNINHYIEIIDLSIEYEKGKVALLRKNYAESQELLSRLITKRNELAAKIANIEAIVTLCLTGE